MAKHVIRPFITSRIPCDRSIFTYLNNIGQMVMTPVIAWYIEGPREKILKEMADILLPLHLLDPKAQY